MWVPLKKTRSICLCVDVYGQVLSSSWWIQRRKNGRWEPLIKLIIESSSRGQEEGQGGTHIQPRHPHSPRGVHRRISFPNPKRCTKNKCFSQVINGESQLRSLIHLLHEGHHGFYWVNSSHLMEFWHVLRLLYVDLHVYVSKMTILISFVRVQWELEDFRLIRRMRCGTLWVNGHLSSGTTAETQRQ